MSRTFVLVCALRSGVAALGLIVAGCAASPERPTYQITDLTDDYIAFFDRTAGLDTAARVSEFKVEMNRRLPGFYDPERPPGAPAVQYDARIARSFAEFPAQRAGFSRAAASFQSMLGPAIDSFVRTFADFRNLGRIALLHSLGEMDGGTRTFKGQGWLVFGADMIASIHGTGNARAFFHHELFHVYHAQFFAECEQVWCALWAEGLAVHVAAQLNPGASDADLLLNEPEPIRAKVDANLSRAVCAIRARLDSKDQEDYAAFFYGSSRFGDLPPRSGYYVGYLAARWAGKQRSPAELAHLDAVQARAALEAALAGLATCP